MSNLRTNFADDDYEMQSDLNKHTNLIQNRTVSQSEEADLLNSVKHKVDEAEAGNNLETVADENEQSDDDDSKFLHKNVRINNFDMIQGVKSHVFQLT